jgi:hypothetical protein
MIIVRLLSPKPFGWFGTTKVYSGVGADIVMESITLIENFRPAVYLRFAIQAVALTVKAAPHFGQRT